MRVKKFILFFLACITKLTHAIAQFSIGLSNTSIWSTTQTNPHINPFNEADHIDNIYVSITGDGALSVAHPPGGSEYFTTTHDHEFNIFFTT